MTKPGQHRLNAADLRHCFDEKDLIWESTRDVSPCDEIIGQERALRAIRLGLEMDSAGYNIFVTGLSGTGKSTTIKSLLQEIDRSGHIPPDLCYVFNFKHPERPRILYLPAGSGNQLREAMDRLVEYCRTHIPEVIESDNFKKRWDDLLETARVREKEILRGFENRVNERSFTLIPVQYGTIQRPELMPVVAGNPVAIGKLEEMTDQGKHPREEFEKTKATQKELAKEMADVAKQLKTLQKNLSDSQQLLAQELIRPFLDETAGEIKSRLPWSGVAPFLDEVKEHILQHLDIFREKTEDKENIFASLMAPKEPGDPFVPFKVNVLVDNSELTAAPIVIETTPTFRNIFGTIERSLDRSGPTGSDFMKIRAGSLLQANGGYLVLNARDALVEPEVYKNLKRVLKYNQITIQAMDTVFPFVGVSITPEPVDLQVKVVILGDKEVYHLLFGLDEDFRKIFKVLADFDSVMPNTPSNIACFAALMRKICDEEKLLPFDREGIRAVLEQSVRLAGRKNKLTARFSDVADLMREAHYWANTATRGLVSREHVQRAIQEKIFRHSLPEERLEELMVEDVLLITTEGSAIGQINGLSVYQLGYHAFGKPTRITAEVSVGSAGLINVEREAGLSGMIHDKGVLIISNLIRSRYTQDKPLGMNASLCFEQSYGGVDGDSASSTEVYAILSALSGIPIRQDLAVTGSVNQKGQIQPVGGINEKIEGFYDLCAARGLTGRQGVIIPRQNVNDLMLRESVVESVRQNQFHIYAISHIDEGLELLTGMTPGIRDETRNWTPGSINDLVNRKLQGFADTMRQYQRPI